MSLRLSDNGLGMIQDGNNSQNCSLHATPEGSIEDQQYESEFEQTNENYGSKVSTPSCTKETQLPRKYLHSSGSGRTDYRRTQPEKGIGKARPFRGYPPHVPVSKRRGSQMSGRTMQHSDMNMNRWESLQLQLAEAHSQNVLLQRQLQECRVELKTVQRQNKLQAARLNKAIGQEADMPRIIDHMTADIRSLQARLREKTNQNYAAQQKISELQRRNAVLQKECDEKQNLVFPDGSMIKKQVNRIDEILGELDCEKKKVAVLQHQLEVANRSQKHQANIANNRIRQLRKNCRELESQLAELMQRLQEKVKLLESHNIYSQRLPRYIPNHLPPAHAMTPEEQKETPLVRSHLTQVTSHRTMEVCEESGSDKTQRIAEQLCGRTSATLSLTESASSAFFGKQDAITEIAKKSTELTSHLNEFIFEQTVPQTVQSASGTSPVEIAENLFVLTAKDTADTGVTQLDELISSQTSEVVPSDYSKSIRSTQLLGDDQGDHENEEEVEMEANTKSTPLADESSTLVPMSITFGNETSQVHSGEQKAKVSSVGSPDRRSLSDSCSSPSPFYAHAAELSISTSVDDEKELERKTRLLMTLEKLDERVADTFPQSIQRLPSLTGSEQDEYRIGFESMLHEPSKSQVEKEERMEVKFDKRREQELWEELFGSSAPENIAEKKTAPRIPITRAVKQVNDNSGSFTKLAESKRTAQQRRNEFGTPIKRLPDTNPSRGRTSNCTPAPPKQSTSIPTLPGLNESKQIQSGRIHPKYAPVRPFRDDDDDDSELEHFQA
ncbi:hypothetical protein CRM22_009408 [Opisthorchis felineus]|uniref:Lebercilin domain-containing protein n=1 Tax=Opisthorchis felineus TaxID=147828 RepID=A0A4S2LER7_OPIFE|nr:hypothetical protein CRM22_009408 [Opisthorchis felineus]